jgi:transposase
LQSTPESGGRAGYDGAKRRNGSKIHAAVERSFAWTGRFRRLARDYERLTTTLVGLHYVAFAVLMRQRLVSQLVVHNRL